MIRIIALLILSAQLWGADGPRIFYSREQPGSAPEYVQIVVNRDYPSASLWRTAVKLGVSDARSGSWIASARHVRPSPDVGRTASRGHVVIDLLKTLLEDPHD